MNYHAAAAAAIAAITGCTARAVDSESKAGKTQVHSRHCHLLFQSLLPFRPLLPHLFFLLFLSLPTPSLLLLLLLPHVRAPTH